MADIATRGALVKIDRWLVGEGDLLNLPVTCLGQIERWLFKIEVTQVADFVWHLEMFLFRRLEVTGIAGNYMAVQGLFGKVNFVLEAHLLGVLNIFLRHRFTIMATGL